MHCLEHKISDAFWIKEGEALLMKSKPPGSEGRHPMGDKGGPADYPPRWRDDERRKCTAIDDHTNSPVVGDNF